MEKISLKPVSHEINYKATEPNTYFDGFEYSSPDEKGKHLGILYVVGQVKYGEENMAYVLNLVSSLAKREYYSENGTSAEEPKKALDATLKKLNGVLEDFFQNKDLKLNIGLMAVAGENIYIAKLGKFKVFLARKGEMIDILNNINLFQKEHVQEKQFVNIISGKIFDGDKIFAIYPTRQTTAKEKLIKSALVKHGQEDFLAELASYGENSRTFQCCGFYIEIRKVKEEDITIKSAYEKSKIILASSSPLEIRPSPLALAVEKKPEEKSVEIIAEENEAPKQAKILSADMALIERKNIFSKIGELFSHKPAFRTKNIVPAMIILLMLVGGVIAVKKFIFNGQDEQALSLKSAAENIRLAETQLIKKENNSARELLGLSLASLAKVKETNRKVAEMRSRIATILDRLDLVSNKQPEMWFDAGATAISQLGPVKDGLLAATAGNKVVKIADGKTTDLGTLPEMEIKHLFVTDKYFSAYNGHDQISVLILPSGKVTSYKLPEASPAQDAAVYEDNLYILSGNSIYKYSDGAITGGKPRQTWFSSLADQNARAMAIDGNVYVLTGEGIVIKYFKNKEESRINLNIKVSEKIEFSVEKDAPYFSVADYDDRKIRLFDKNSGALLVTYKFGDLPVIKHFAVLNHIAYLISGDNKIWKIDLGQ